MINWEQVDDVFLDMDGTLLDLDFDNHFWLEHLPKRYSEIRGLNAEDVKRQLYERFQLMQGTLDWYCLEYWQRELDIQIVDLKREVVERIRFRPHAKDFLKWLSTSGKRVALVTNAHRWSIELKFEYLNMQQYFDLICSSHDYLAPKESQQFWQSLQQELKFNRSRTLFIDDNHDVLNSARQFGIGHLLTIDKPDSTKPVKPAGDYQAVSDYRDLMYD